MERASTEGVEEMRVSRSGLGAELMRVSAGSISAENSKVTGPTPMRSPARRWLGFPMVAPFSSVPLAEPLSSNIQPATCRSMRACVRETPGSLSPTSFSAPRPMVTRWASNWNFCPRPLPSAMVSTNAISKIPAEEHLVGDGAEEHDEEGREDESDQRQEQLDRRFVGQLLRPLRALDAHLGGEDTKYLSQRRAQLVRLDERVHEAAQGGKLDSRGEVAQRFLAGLAQLQLFQRDRQLVRERTLAPLLHHLRQRGGEVEAGLHREREQVEVVGQRAGDGLVPRAHLVAQPDERIAGAEGGEEERVGEVEVEPDGAGDADSEEGRRRQLREGDDLG